MEKQFMEELMALLEQQRIAIAELKEGIERLESKADRLLKLIPDSDGVPPLRGSPQ